MTVKELREYLSQTPDDVSVLILAYSSDVSSSYRVQEISVVSQEVMRIDGRELIFVNLYGK